MRTLILLKILIFTLPIYSIAEYKACLYIDFDLVRQIDECLELCDITLVATSSINSLLLDDNYEKRMQLHPVNVLSIYENNGTTTDDYNLALLFQLAPYINCSEYTTMNETLSSHDIYPEQLCRYNVSEITRYSAQMRYDTSTGWHLHAYTKLTISSLEVLEMKEDYANSIYFYSTLQFDPEVLLDKNYVVVNARVEHEESSPVPSSAIGFISIAFVLCLALLYRYHRQKGYMRIRKRHKEVV